MLENGCCHCNIHLKIGHGHEERHRMARDRGRVSLAVV